jgi:hypothetical protein
MDNRTRYVFLVLTFIACGRAPAAIVDIDPGNSEQTIQASDGIANNGGFVVTGVPFSGSDTVHSPGGVASTTTSVNIGASGDIVVIDLVITQTMSGLGGTTNASGSITFFAPVQALYYRVDGSYATSFDDGGVSFFDLSIGSYSDSQQVVGAGTGWDFDIDGGPEPLSQISYVFTTNAVSTNTVGSGSVNLQFTLSTNPVVVPLPAAAWLLVSGLLGIAGLGRDPGDGETPGEHPLSAPGNGSGSDEARGLTRSALLKCLGDP